MQRACASCSRLRRGLQHWILFQPFDVGAGGWNVAGASLNGATWTYRPQGFTATILRIR
ncbi:MAG: hypothetical protein GF355_17155 [Candidatus Eisenbacteria bacterium]|nr:hypothetical protein [Candidatus Eisenbacteria bacterium]